MRTHRLASPRLALCLLTGALLGGCVSATSPTPLCTTDASCPDGFHCDRAAKGCVAGAPVPPALSLLPVTATVETGKSVQLNASVANPPDGNAAVTWTLQEQGGGSVSAAGLYTAPGAPGVFHVRAAVAGALAVTATAAVTVIHALPRISSFSAAKGTVTAGDRVALVATFASGAGAVDQRVGVVTSGAETLSPPLLVDTLFTLTVVNAAGVAATATVAVKVVAPPQITAFAAVAGTISSGATAQLNVAFSGGTASIDQGLGAIALGGVLTTAALSADTTFTLTVTNAAGAAVTGRASVKVVPLPAVSAFSAARPILTAGGKPSLTAVFTGGTGRIDQGVGPVSSGVAATGPALATATTFTLTVTSPAGATVTAKVDVKVVAAPQITGFNAVNATVTTGTRAQLDVAFAAGVAVIDQGIGPVSASGIVTTPALGAGATFTLRVTNAAGDAATAQVVVEVVPLPAIASFTAAQVTVTAGTAPVLTAAFTGGAGSIDQGVGPVSSGAAAPAPPIGADTVYTLTVTSPAGASVTAAVTVKVADGPSITGFTSSAAVVLSGQTVLLTPAFTGGSGSIDQGIGAVTSGAPIPTAALAASTTFTLTVSAPGGQSTATVTVTLGGVYDGGFTGSPTGIWTFSGGASLNPAATGTTGRVDVGQADFTSAGICGAGAEAHQTVAFPSLRDTGPLELAISVLGGCSGPCAESPSAGVLLGGAGVRTPAAVASGADFTTTTVCVGERWSGAALQSLTVRPLRSSTSSECSLGPTLSVDSVVLQPSATCPAAATIPNADFEGPGNWTLAGLASIDAGVGVSASRGLHLRTATQCDTANAVGTLSVPYDSLSNVALQFRYAGTPNAAINLADTHFGGALGSVQGKGTSTFSTARVCLPEYLRGMALPVRFALRRPLGGPNCATADTEDFFVDDLAFVSDSTCAQGAPLTATDFERADDSVPFITALSNAGAPAGIDAAASNAHGGSRSLFGTVSTPCDTVRFSVAVTVPAASAAGGPALKFWARRSEGATSAALRVDGGAMLTPGAAYSQFTACLNPSLASLGSRVSLEVTSGGGTCSSNFPTETIWIDDVQAATDPSCPVN